MGLSCVVAHLIYLDSRLTSVSFSSFQCPTRNEVRLQTVAMADPTSPSPYSENKRFEPKVPVELNEPKSDEITLEELAKNDGTSLSIARRGTTSDGGGDC